MQKLIKNEAKIIQCSNFYLIKSVQYSFNSSDTLIYGRYASATQQILLWKTHYLFTFEIFLNI